MTLYKNKYRIESARLMGWDYSSEWYCFVTVWLTQKKMAELFDVNVPAISKHLSSIFKEGELQKEATISKMETVQSSDKVFSFILEHTTQYSLLGTNCPQIEAEVL